MSDQFWALLLFALVATGSPGGATTLATASGARFGYRPSLPLIFGIAGALSVLVAVSGTGLASTLQVAPWLNTGVRMIGSIYLLWLAVSIGLAGAPSTISDEYTPPMTFTSAAVLLLMNPKAWAMAVGVASSFSDIVAGPLLLGCILGMVFGLSAVLSLSVWALAGGFVARYLKTERHWQFFNATMAFLLLVSVLQLWI